MGRFRNYPTNPAAMGDAVKAWLGTEIAQQDGYLNRLANKRLHGALLSTEVVAPNDIYSIDEPTSRTLGVLRLRFGSRMVQIDTRGHVEDVD